MGGVVAITATTAIPSAIASRFPGGVEAPARATECHNRRAGQSTTSAIMSVGSKTMFVGRSSTLAITISAKSLIGPISLIPVNPATVSIALAAKTPRLDAAPTLSRGQASSAATRNGKKNNPAKSLNFPVNGEGITCFNTWSLRTSTPMQINDTGWASAWREIRSVRMKDLRLPPQGQGLAPTELASGLIFLAFTRFFLAPAWR